MLTLQPLELPQLPGGGFWTTTGNKHPRSHSTSPCHFYNFRTIPDVGLPHNLVASLRYISDVYDNGKLETLFLTTKGYNIRYIRAVSIHANQPLPCPNTPTLGGWFPTRHGVNINLYLATKKKRHFTLAISSRKCKHLRSPFPLPSGNATWACNIPPLRGDAHWRQYMELQVVPPFGT